MMQIFSILTFLQVRRSCGLIHLLKLAIWASSPHILLSVWLLVLLVINSIMEVSYVELLIAYQSSGLWHRSVNFAAFNGQEVMTSVHLFFLPVELIFVVWEKSWNLHLRCGEILSMIVLLWCVLSSVKQCGALILWFWGFATHPVVFIRVLWLGWGTCFCWKRLWGERSILVISWASELAD